GKALAKETILPQLKTETQGPLAPRAVRLIERGTKTFKGVNDTLAQYRRSGTHAQKVLGWAAPVALPIVASAVSLAFLPTVSLPLIGAMPAPAILGLVATGSALTTWMKDRKDKGAKTKEEKIDEAMAQERRATIVPSGWNPGSWIKAGYSKIQETRALNVALPILLAGGAVALSALSGGGDLGAGAMAAVGLGAVLTKGGRRGSRNKPGPEAEISGDQLGTKEKRGRKPGSNDVSDLDPLGNPSRDTGGDSGGKGYFDDYSSGGGRGAVLFSDFFGLGMLTRFLLNNPVSRWIALKVRGFFPRRENQPLLSKDEPSSGSQEIASGIQSPGAFDLAYNLAVGAMVKDAGAPFASARGGRGQGPVEVSPDKIEPPQKSWEYGPAKLVIADAVGQEVKARVLQEIQYARTLSAEERVKNSGIRMMAFLITEYELANLLVEAVAEGVPVEIIMDGSQTGNKNSQYKVLKAAGVNIKILNGFSPNEIMHIKYVYLKSQNVAILGSANFSYSAMKRGSNIEWMFRFDPAKANNSEERRLAEAMIGMTQEVNEYLLTLPEGKTAPSKEPRFDQLRALTLNMEEAVQYVKDNWGESVRQWAPVGQRQVDADVLAVILNKTAWFSRVQTLGGMRRSDLFVEKSPEGSQEPSLSKIDPLALRDQVTGLRPALGSAPPATQAPRATAPLSVKPLTLGQKIKYTAINGVVGLAFMVASLVSLSMSSAAPQLIGLAGAAMTALSIHELGHGLAAKRYGALGAEEQKRLGINPLRHYQPWAWMLVAAGAFMASPVGLMLMGMGMFWFTKPLDINLNEIQSKQGARASRLILLLGPAANAVAGILSFALSSFHHYFFFLSIANFVIATVNLLPLFIGNRSSDGFQLLQNLAPRVFTTESAKAKNLWLALSLVILAAVVQYGIPALIDLGGGMSSLMISGSVMLPLVALGTVRNRRGKSGGKRKTGRREEGKKEVQIESPKGFSSLDQPIPAVEAIGILEGLYDHGQVKMRFMPENRDMVMDSRSALDQIIARVQQGDLVLYRKGGLSQGYFLMGTAEIAAEGATKRWGDDEKGGRRGDATKAQGKANEAAGAGGERSEQVLIERLKNLGGFDFKTPVSLGVSDKFGEEQGPADDLSHLFPPQDLVYVRLESGGCLPIKRSAWQNILEDLPQGKAAGQPALNSGLDKLFGGALERLERYERTLEGVLRYIESDSKVPKSAKEALRILRAIGVDIRYGAMPPGALAYFHPEDLRVVMSADLAEASLEYQAFIFIHEFQHAYDHAKNRPYALESEGRAFWAETLPLESILPKDLPAGKDSDLRLRTMNLRILELFRKYKKYPALFGDEVTKPYVEKYGPYLAGLRKAKMYLDDIEVALQKKTIELAELKKKTDFQEHILKGAPDAEIAEEANENFKRLAERTAVVVQDIKRLERLRDAISREADPGSVAKIWVGRVQAWEVAQKVNRIRNEPEIDTLDGFLGAKTEEIKDNKALRSVYRRLHLMLLTLFPLNLAPLAAIAGAPGITVERHVDIKNHLARLLKDQERGPLFLNLIKEKGFLDGFGEFRSILWQLADDMEDLTYHAQRMTQQGPIKFEFQPSAEIRSVLIRYWNEDSKAKLYLEELLLKVTRGNEGAGSMKALRVAMDHSGVANYFSAQAILAISMALSQIEKAGGKADVANGEKAKEADGVAKAKEEGSVFDNPEVLAKVAPLLMRAFQVLALLRPAMERDTLNAKTKESLVSLYLNLITSQAFVRLLAMPQAQEGLAEMAEDLRVYSHNPDVRRVLWELFITSPGPVQATVLALIEVPKILPLDTQMMQVLLNAAPLGSMDEVMAVETLRVLATSPAREEYRGLVESYLKGASPDARGEVVMKALSAYLGDPEVLKLFVKNATDKSLAFAERRVYVEALSASFLKVQNGLAGFGSLLFNAFSKEIVRRVSWRPLGGVGQMLVPNPAEMEETRARENYLLPLATLLAKIGHSVATKEAAGAAKIDGPNRSLLFNIGGVLAGLILFSVGAQTVMASALLGNLLSLAGLAVGGISLFGFLSDFFVIYMQFLVLPKLMALPFMGLAKLAQWVLPDGRMARFFGRLSSHSSLSPQDFELFLDVETLKDAVKTQGVASVSQADAKKIASPSALMAVLAIIDSRGAAKMLSELAPEEGIGVVGRLLAHPLYASLGLRILAQFKKNYPAPYSLLTQMAPLPKGLAGRIDRTLRQIESGRVLAAERMAGVFIEKIGGLDPEIRPLIKPYTATIWNLKLARLDLAGSGIYMRTDLAHRPYVFYKILANKLVDAKSYENQPMKKWMEELKANRRHWPNRLFYFFTNFMGLLASFVPDLLIYAAGINPFQLSVYLIQMPLAFVIYMATVNWLRGETAPIVWTVQEREAGGGNQEA
ncbi:MAG: phospholipase D-like domain-containing protein, partial [Elusimicrobiota bacterium]